MTQVEVTTGFLRPITGPEKIKLAMVVLFSAIGILLWVGVLFAVMVLCGVVWLFCQTMLGITAFVSALTRPNRLAPPSSRTIRPAPKPVAPPRNVPPTPKPPVQKPAATEVMPDLIPKWTAAHRRYVNQDLADWQKQFDSLNSRRL